MQYVQRVQSVQPKQYVQSVQSVQYSQSLQSVQPVQPVQSVQRVQSVQSVQRVQCVQYVESFILINSVNSFILINFVNSDSDKDSNSFFVIVPSPLVFFFYQPAYILSLSMRQHSEIHLRFCAALLLLQHSNRPPLQYPLIHMSQDEILYP